MPGHLASSDVMAMVIYQRAALVRPRSAFPRSPIEQFAVTAATTSGLSASTDNGGPAIVGGLIGAIGFGNGHAGAGDFVATAR